LRQYGDRGRTGRLFDAVEDPDVAQNLGTGDAVGSRLRRGFADSNKAAGRGLGLGDGLVRRCRPHRDGGIGRGDVGPAADLGQRQRAAGHIGRRVCIVGSDKAARDRVGNRIGLVGPDRIDRDLVGAGDVGTDEGLGVGLDFCRGLARSDRDKADRYRVRERVGVAVAGGLEQHRTIGDNARSVRGIGLDRGGIRDRGVGARRLVSDKTAASRLGDRRRVMAPIRRDRNGVRVGDVAVHPGDHAAAHVGHGIHHRYRGQKRGARGLHIRCGLVLLSGMRRARRNGARGHQCRRADPRDNIRCAGDRGDRLSARTGAEQADIGDIDIGIGHVFACGLEDQARRVAVVIDKFTVELGQHTAAYLCLWQHHRNRH